MEKEIEDLFDELSTDIDFFKSYQNVFVENFSNHIHVIIGKDIQKGKLKSIALSTYKKLFSFKNDYRDEFYNLGRIFAEKDINIKPLFTKTFLMLVRDCSDYLLENGKGLKNLKNLLGLIDLYLLVIDKAYTDYTKILEKELKETKKKVKKKDTENITQILKLILKDKSEIMVFNYYKQIPIIMKLPIKGITENSIILDISKIHIDLKKLGNVFYKKHKLLPKTVKTHIKNIDIQKDEIVLSDFEYVELHQEKRKYVRVLLEKPIPVSIKKGALGFEGLIVDICIGGIGVYLEDINGLEKEDEVYVEFELENINLKIKGNIRYFEKLERKYKVGIQLFPNAKEEDIIAEYVTFRQFQILKEIR